MLPHLRLMHLVSPSLPIGAYSYSQGLEWAVDNGWVRDRQELSDWVDDIAQASLKNLEVPILARLYNAAEQNDSEKLAYWSDYLIASRETSELREEERNRARAMASLLPQLGIPIDDSTRESIQSCQLAGFAHAASYWQIPLETAAAGYCWGWIENNVLAGVKIIPLGQTDGQKVLADLTLHVPAIIADGLRMSDNDIGASCIAQAIASSRHETQYTRIYRS